MKQRISGTSWDAMLGSFKVLIAKLYEGWKSYLLDSLSEQKKKIFQSYMDEIADGIQLRVSLERLTTFLAKKSGRKVIILIDEYDAPNNRAYEFNFFKQVCPSSPSRL